MLYCIHPHDEGQRFIAQSSSVLVMHLFFPLLFFPPPLLFFPPPLLYSDDAGVAMTSALNLFRSPPSHCRSSLPVRQQRHRNSLYFRSSSSSTFSMDLSRSASTIFGESVNTCSSVAYSSDSFTNSAEDRELECGNSLDSAIEKQGIRIRRRPPTGPSTHAVGPFEFRLENEGNTPRNILEKIIWNKHTEISQLKERKPLVVLGREVNNAPPVRDFVGALKASYQRTGMPALIAEVKKASPSRGVLREDFDPIQIANAYETNGAACLSVLTDEKYFQGSFENLDAIRRAGVQCPLLCKEFIIDAWQLYYARSKGADAILLIAAVLPDLDIKYMTKICSKLGLAVLVEVHDEREMDRVLGIDGIQLIGINNRNLETFEVDISNTKRLLEGDRGEIIRQKGIIVVGESGLFTPEDISYVQEAGVKAVLVGESLIKQEDPGRGIARLFGIDISV